jgi:hypothetical protein
VVGSCTKPFPGRNQFGRPYADRVCSGQKVWFMPAQEVQHCAEHCRLAEPIPQGLGSQAGQRQQPFGAGGIAQHPPQRGKRQGFGIGSGGWRVSQNCQPRLQRIERLAL